MSEKDRISDEKIEAGIGSPVIWFCVALLTYVLSNGPAAWLHEKTSSARLKAGLETLNALRIRAAFTILMLAVIVCACSTHRLAIRIPAHAPAVVFTDGRREHDPGFSGHEQALVGFARRHLVRSRRSAIDAYYRVRHTFDGNEVIVMYVSSYDECAQPVFGNYCTVLLREDGSLIRVFPGGGG